MTHTIGEAGIEVERNGMVELFVNLVEKLLLSVGHEMMKGRWRGVETGRLRGGKSGETGGHKRMRGDGNSGRGSDGAQEVSWDQYYMARAPAALPLAEIPAFKLSP